jgi:hypothetical protein
MQKHLKIAITAGAALTLGALAGAAYLAERLGPSGPPQS